jgi:hypothetical protein
MKRIAVLITIVALLIPAALFAAGAQETEKTIINFPPPPPQGLCTPSARQSATCGTPSCPTYVRAHRQAPADREPEHDRRRRGATRSRGHINHVHSFNGIVHSRVGRIPTCGS